MERTFGTLERGGGHRQVRYFSLAANAIELNQMSADGPSAEATLTDAPNVKPRHLNCAEVSVQV